MGHTKKGFTLRLNAAPVFGVPFFFAVDIHNVGWTYAQDNPPFWGFYTSTTFSGTYTLQLTAAGNARSLFHGTFYNWGYIVGQNGAGTPVAGNSNIIAVN